VKEQNMFHNYETEKIRRYNLCVVHDDLGWKNRTTRCNRFWSAGCSRLQYV